MPTYRISGIWKNDNNVITHYAFHTVNADSTNRAIKKTKAEAITMVEAIGNITTTWLWNYNTAAWSIGETVHVVNGLYGKFLRTNHDNQVKDNLLHLIDYDWIAP